MVVLPEQDTVVAFFSHTNPMQSFMDHLWNHLLPALGPPRDPDPDADAALAERISDLHVATAAERTVGAVPVGRMAGARFERAEGPVPSHPSITALDIDGDELVIHEEEGPLRVPLSTSWDEATDAPIATSAAVDQAGHIHIDLVMLATPHRLELQLDPRSSTFTATWPTFPLFGLGLDTRLARMRPPGD